MAKIPHFVISLPTSIARRESIREQFKQQNIDFLFYDALPTPPNPIFEREINRIAPCYAESKYKMLTTGEKSCAMSHFLLWEKCVNEGHDYIGIFEDDAILSSESYKLLQDDQWIRNRSTQSSELETAEQFSDEVIIRLETYFNLLKQKPTKIKKVDGFMFNRLLKRHYGTAGYIISRGAAKRLLDFIKNELTRATPIDVLIFDRYLLNDDFIQVIQVFPGIVAQENVINLGKGFGSDLQAERIGRFDSVGPFRPRELMSTREYIEYRKYKLAINWFKFVSKLASKGKWTPFTRKFSFVPFKP